jgi:hypothetical protein
MEFSGLVSFVYVKSVHVDQEFGKFCGAPYVAEGDYSVVEDPASGPAHRRLGERRRLPTRDEDSTATAGIR